jgi:hypothetical protein
MPIGKVTHFHCESGWMYQRDHYKDEVFTAIHPNAPGEINAM